MVFVMVVLGGVTRLTHAGLSMVEWRPLTGILPPLTTAEWEEVFAAYRQYPEFQKLNRGMDLAGFKAIFWLEYMHRLWGRAIGVVFVLPFLYFLARRRIARSLAPKLAIMFVLGGLQGFLGWYMVRSGLVDRPDVSQYRLTAHLGAAIAIYGYMFWVALDLLLPGLTTPVETQQPLRRFGLALLAMIAVTVLSGGLVAGTDAGFAYNTFPLMDGRLVPGGLLDMEPSLANAFENIIMVQFNHRVLAIATALLSLALWLLARRAHLPPRARAAFHALLGAATLQFGFGVATLLSVVALPVAAAHQAGALVLLTALLWALFEVRTAAPRVG
jgi:cytochrome c oxidase assembly protein subunit 15